MSSLSRFTKLGPGGDEHTNEAIGHGGRPKSTAVGTLDGSKGRDFSKKMEVETVEKTHIHICIYIYMSIRQNYWNTKVVKSCLELCLPSRNLHNR